MSNLLPPATTTTSSTSQNSTMSANEPVYNTSRPLPFRQFLYQYELANSPGQSIIVFRVTFPRNGAFPPHRHSDASVIGYVPDGAVLNRMNDEPVQVLAVGEGWYEAPGCHHRTVGKHLATEQTTVLATYVVDTEMLREGGLAALAVVDEEFRGVGAAFVRIGEGSETSRGDYMSADS